MLTLEEFKQGVTIKLDKTLLLPNVTYPNGLPEYVTGMGITAKPVKARRWREDQDLHIPPGDYDLELISYPGDNGYYRPDWMVIKDTLVGAACQWWQWFLP